MSQTHLELFHLTSMLEGLVDDLPDAGPSAPTAPKPAGSPLRCRDLGLLNLADGQRS